ncbi:beta-ketoacyl-ACP synthase 3 [Thalassobacillus sp. C254]|uniref:beta-ketoacyl-ACP synthase 3 n=1 Tax=Thalassobacillus sp. C254 TaxID=1225341 RepID=UPI000AAAD011|nr:beta-ketoacyl-ACP synthase 3 [Thalassobacillus sp. C254]
MKRAVIKGVGAYVPEKVLTNKDLEEMMDTSDEWITTRTGIHERRIIGEEEDTSFLGYQASLQALKDAHLKAEDIDMLIVATETPDHMFPPVAVRFQHLLKCRQIGAFDIHSTCVGFLTALQTAEQYVKMGKVKHVLVVGADALSKIVDYSDRSTAILFADGAGAFIVSAEESDESRGIIDSTIHSDGQHYYDLYVESGGSKESPQIVMNGNKIFKLAVSAKCQNDNRAKQLAPS